MSIFNWKKDKTPSTTDNYLYNRLNLDLNYCGLSPEIQKGFLFYLGAAINIGINESSVDITQFMETPELERQTFAKIITTYSESTGNFANYGDLNDGIFSETIYTANSIIFQLTGLDPNKIDDHLRTVEISKNHSSKLLKTTINKELKDKYENAKYNLNVCHNLVEDIFFKIGDHLHSKGYDLAKSYEAGYAYFCMQTTMDVNGTRFLLSTIYNTLSPLYQALFSYPILHFAHPEALKANHIFSNTLQMFYGGINTDIIQPIHWFHQAIFYTPNSVEFGSSWNFETREDSDKQINIFLSALSIRNTDIMDLKSDFLTYKEFMCPELKNSKLNANELFETIIMGIIRKYNIYPAQNDPEVWNNLGDVIQFFGILFYETCLHAVVVDEITNND